MGGRGISYQKQESLAPRKCRFSEITHYVHLLQPTIKMIWKNILPVICGGDGRGAGGEEKQEKKTYGVSGKFRRKFFSTGRITVLFSERRKTYRIKKKSRWDFLGT